MSPPYFIEVYKLILMNSKDPYKYICVSKNQIYLLKTFSKSFVNLFIVFVLILKMIIQS